MNHQSTGKATLRRAHRNADCQYAASRVADLPARHRKRPRGRLAAGETAGWQPAPRHARRVQGGPPGWLLGILLALLTGCGSIPSKSDHEYAPLQERTLDYKDWTLPAWRTGAPVHLRSWAGQPGAGSRLVWVVYLAPWCPNWRYQSPLVARLQAKYHEHGLRVLGVSEYGTIEELNSFFGPNLPSYPIVIESELTSARETTPHFHYRQQAGDTRKWGSPWNLFFIPAERPLESDVVADRIWVANGELVEAEGEAFIRARLGLSAEANVERPTLNPERR